MAKVNLQNVKIKRHSYKHSKTEGLTVREHKKAISLYLKHYKKGVTVSTALDMSLEVDRKRSKEELKAFYIRSSSKDIFTFTVRASKKHKINFFGVPKDEIAEYQQVNIKWDIGEITEVVNEDEVTNILLNAPIHYECSCGRHTYFYRYTWTILRSSLGLQQHIFPRKTNGHLKGLVCKHGIRVIEVIKDSQHFKRIFSRWLTNKLNNKQTRISAKDKVLLGKVTI